MRDADRHGERTTTGMPERDEPIALTTEERLSAVTVGEVVPLAGPVELVDYDPAWPERYAREEARIRGALGEVALLVEHVGSTSVPDLAAKPRIDILLVVADSADEPAFVPALEAAGYTLRIREPEWLEHRMFWGPEFPVNLHVFSPGCPEIERMLLFRDHLRATPADRLRYERTKRELAAQTWQYIQHYADAKTRVVDEILTRAREARGVGLTSIRGSSRPMTAVARLHIVVGEGHRSVS